MNRALRTVAGTAIWAGLAAMLARQIVSADYSTARLDLLACLAIIALGFWLREAADRRVCGETVSLAVAPRRPQPVGFYVVDHGWPIAYHPHAQFIFWFTCLLCLPVMLGVHGSTATPADVAADSPGAFSEMGGFGVPNSLIWAAVIGYFALKDHRKAVKKIGRVLTSGGGHALPVVVSDRFGRNPESAQVDAAYSVDHSLNAHAEYAASEPALSPYKSGGLCLLAAGGERSLFLDRRADPLVVSDVLAGREGWLYWVPANEPMTRTSVPAVLVLGDGRYLRGWTQDNGQTNVPDGVEVTVRPGLEQPVRPVDVSVLRARTTRRPALYYFAAATALLASGFLGLWGDFQEEAGGVPLMGGAFLVAIGLSVGRLGHTPRATTPPSGILDADGNLPD
ncbi:hypothetical protein, partial [Streptomyces alkaliterrae]